MDPSEEFTLFSKLIKSHKSLLKACVEMSKALKDMESKIEYLNKCNSLETLVLDDLQQRVETLESEINKNTVK